MHFDVFHTQEGISSWWLTRPAAWTYMGQAIWDEVQSNWRPPYCWGWRGYKLRQRWGQRPRASRM